MINITEQDNELLEWVYDHSGQDYLLALLNTSTYEGRARKELEIEINDMAMTNEDFNKISFQLLSNQLDRITSGLSYSATDIQKHLRKFM